MLTRDLIRRTFTPVAIERGEGYHRDGAVKSVQVIANGTEIRGTVQGNAAAPYRCRVGVRQTRLDTTCSCPLGGDCKHVVALLLEVLAQQRRPEPPPTDLVRSPRPTPPPSPGLPALSGPLAEWLGLLERAGGSEAYPPEVRRRLIYVLSARQGGEGQIRLSVVAMSTPLLKDGSFSTAAQPYPPANALAAKPAQFLRPSDYTILRRIYQEGAGRHGGEGILSGESGAEILGLILATGRARWQTLTGPELRQGEARPGRIDWGAAGPGRLRPVALTPDHDGTVLVLTPPWYVDGAAGLCGPVETGLPPRLAGLLLDAPPIDFEQVAPVRARLAAMLPAKSAALPPEIAPMRRLKVDPVPRLWLHTMSVPIVGVPSWRGVDRSRITAVPLARLSFLYEGQEVPWHQTGTSLRFLVGTAACEIARQRKQEQRALSQLETCGLNRVNKVFGWGVTADCAHDFLFATPTFEEAWIAFLSEDVPALTAAGWQIDLAPDFPIRIASADGPIEAAFETASGIDWFELHLGVTVDGVRINLLPPLLDLLGRTSPAEIAAFLEEEEIDPGEVRPLRVRLEDGRILSLPFARMRPILLALAGLFTEGAVEGETVRLGLAEATLAATFAAAVPDLVWRGDDALRRLGQRLHDANGLPPVSPPASFTGSLRPYQQTGVAWMQVLREVGLGGVLADDMGLGKTVQTLAHLAIEQAEGRLDRPCLVIAPTSLMANWRAEAACFTPTLRVLVLQGSGRKEQFDQIAAHDLVLTTYPLLPRDAGVLTAQPWHLVILDEAQVVKNPATAAAKVLRRLDARHRLALSGTPLENHLGELWSLFDFVSPGFLGDRNGFVRRWRTPIEKKGDADRRVALSRRVKPFLLRRTKALVAADLPPKTEIIEPIDLGAAQRDLYEAIRLTMHEKVRAAIATKGLARSRIEFLDALLKLRQVCCDPRLVKRLRGAAQAGSAKLDRLMEMLPAQVEAGRRILLFSQFTSMLALIETELEAAGLPYVLLTGDTTDRATPVRRFQDGEVPLFLISLKAGGTGLNLTAADTVIHYDPWWNPAVEAQATDRAHRIGQDKPVFVHKLVAQDSIEVKMTELKARKQALADGLFDPDATGAPALCEEDIEYLLGG